MDLQGRLLQMLQAQENGSRQESSSSDSSPSRRNSSGSSSPRRSRRDRKRRTRRRSRSSGRRYRERRSSRDHRRERDRRGRRPMRSRDRRSYRERGSRRDKPHLGSDFKHKRAPDGRPFCIDFQLGRCRRDNCRYYHQTKEKCIDFGRGRCAYGDKCKFRHDISRDNERRKKSASKERFRSRKARGRDITDKYQVKDASSDRGSPKAKDNDSDPMPTLIQTTQIDVTKSEPTEYIDDMHLTKDDNNEGENDTETPESAKEKNEAEMENSEDSNVDENPESDIIEEETDQIEVVPEKGDSLGEHDNASELSQPDQPVTMKAEPVTMEEEENVEMDVEARG